jgi:hypothetical protein
MMREDEEQEVSAEEAKANVVAAFAQELSEEETIQPAESGMPTGRLPDQHPRPISSAGVR